MELFPHHDHVTPCQDEVACPFPEPVRRVYVQPDEQPATASSSIDDLVGQGDHTEQTLGLRCPPDGDVLVWDKTGDRTDQEALAGLQIVKARAQLARAAAAEVVDPVVAVGRRPQLAQPAKHHWAGTYPHRWPASAQ